MRQRRGDTPPGQLGHRLGRRLRHPGRRHAGPGTAGRHGGADEAACRRQVRRGRLQGVGRPARGRHLGGERVVGMARVRGEARREGLAPGVRPWRRDRRARGGGRRGRRDGHDNQLPSRRRGDLRRARVVEGHPDAAPARDRVPHPWPSYRARRRSRGGGSAGVLLRGRDPRLRQVRQRGQGLGPQAHRLLRGRRRRRPRRGGDAVEHLLRGVGVLVRQQHQHPRGRIAPLRIPERAHGHAQQVRPRQGPAEGEGGEPRRRGRPRGSRGGHLGQAARAAVRGPDEDEARQPAGRGSRPPDRQPAARGVPRGEPPGCSADHHEGDLRFAGPRGGSEGARADASQERPREHVATRGSSPTARSPIPRSRSSTWSRATPPAGRQRTLATGPTRRSCRCAAR